MVRSFFLAIGIFACILGAECLAIDKAVFRATAEPSQSAIQRTFGTVAPPRGREIVPPPWAPWSLLAGGAVTILYSFTIPRRASKQ